MNTRAGRQRALFRALIGMVLAFMMLGAIDVHAVPRGEAEPPEPQTPETREAKRQQMERDMAAWLPRLVGRFDATGVVQHNQDEFVGDSYPPDETRVRSADGKADCIAVGDGAGVQCVLHVTWQEQWTVHGQAVEGGVSFLGPTAILFGFDPNASLIRYLLLTTDGIAESETGTLRGNTLRFYFETHCESNVTKPTADNRGNRCRRVMGIYAPPEAKYITLTIDIEPWSAEAGTWRATPFTSISFDMRRPRTTESDAP